MEASVVVPTYNRPDSLKRAVNSILEQTIEDIELIVVDDGSKDEKQIDFLEEIDNIPSIRVIRQGNEGPAAARNAGWRAAKSHIVLFTDDDCVVPKNWVQRILKAYNGNENIAGVGGPLSPPESLVKTNIFARYDKYKNCYVYGLPDKPVLGRESVPVGGTANMSYRREVLSSVNGFDESFPIAAGEDADLKKRITNDGHELHYIPLAVTHIKSFTLGSFISQSIRRGRGEYHFQRKHGKNRSLPRIFIGFFGTPIGAAAEMDLNQPGVSIVHLAHRFLSRYGELSAAIEQR